MSNKTTQLAAAIVFAVASIFVSSCKKDSKVTPARQLVKIEEDATHYSSLAYNNDNQVSKIITKEGPTTETIDLTYNSAKNIELATVNTLALKFIYTNSQLTKVEYRDASPNNALTFYTEFANQGGKMTEMRTYANYPTGVLPNLKYAYTYNATGDVVTAKEYLWAPNKNEYQLTETTVYEYDDKVNPLAAVSQVAQVFFQATSSHNVVKETVTDALNQVTSTINYSYVYDIKGYPTIATKKETTQLNPNVVTTQVKFTYNN